MSILLDKLVAEKERETLSQNKDDGKWYHAKPLPFYSIKTVLKRIKDGIRVMKGKSFAVHYKEDE